MLFAWQNTHDVSALGVQLASYLLGTIFVMLFLKLRAVFVFLLVLGHLFLLFWEDIPVKNHPSFRVSEELPSLKCAPRGSSPDSLVNLSRLQDLWRKNASKHPRTSPMFTAVAALISSDATPPCVLRSLGWVTALTSRKTGLQAAAAGEN